MKLTIVLEDNLVLVDGIPFNDIDLSSISSEIRAIQWDGTNGHIEYVDRTKPNSPISSITKYKKIVSEHGKKLKSHVENTKPKAPFYFLDGKNWVIDVDLKKKYDDEQMANTIYSTYLNNEESVK